MVSFRQLDETKLVQLDDAGLIEYVIEARAAGDEDAAHVALQIFAFGMEDPVRAFVRGRLGSHGDTAVEEVAERTLESALRSIASLEGSTPQEARAFVFRIARRRIADFLRAARPKIDSIDDEERPDSGRLPDGLRVEDESDLIDAVLLLNQLLDELRSDHRAVVELNVLLGYSARETVELVRSRNDGSFDDSMTEQNVHQIASRFRRDLRARLGDAGEGVSQ